MLHDVAGMEQHAGNQLLAIRQFDAFPDVVLVLVTHVGVLEAVGAGVDLQHVAGYFVHRRFVDAWSFVDAIAGVEADPVLRDALDRFVDDFDVQRQRGL